MVRIFKKNIFHVAASRILLCQGLLFHNSYSEVPNRQADRNKQAGLEKNSSCLLFSLNKLINEQGGIFCLLNEKFHPAHLLIYLANKQSG